MAILSGDERVGCGGVQRIGEVEGAVAPEAEAEGTSKFLLTLPFQFQVKAGPNYSACFRLWRISPKCL